MCVCACGRVLVWAHAWIYVSVEVRGHVLRTQCLSLGWNSQSRLGWMATLSQHWDDKWVQPSLNVFRRGFGESNSCPLVQELYWEWPRASAPYRLFLDSEQKEKSSLSLTFPPVQNGESDALSSFPEGQVALIHLIYLGSTEPGNPAFQWLILWLLLLGMMDRS